MLISLVIGLLLNTQQADMSTINLTAHVVEQEAGNQGFEGRVAVANVIAARTRDSRFPNTVRGVITGRGQFESYESGRYRHVTPTADTYLALLHGFLGEPIAPDAVFFCNYSNIGVKSKRWFDSLEEVVQVRNHTFYK